MNAPDELLKKCSPACKCPSCRLIDCYGRMREFAKNPHETTLMGMYAELGNIRDAIDELFANRPHTQDDEQFWKMRAQVNAIMSASVEYMTDGATKH